MKNLLRRLNNSWQKVPRNRHLIAVKLGLTDEEYKLWDLYIALYDWDKNHLQTYGTVEATDREIAEILKWSPAKVCRVRNTLIRKRVITIVRESCYRISNYSDIPLDGLSTQQQLAEVRRNISLMRQFVAPVKQIQDQDSEIPLVSYKDKYKDVTKNDNKIVLIKQEPRSELEYQRIKEEMGSNSLDIDDMRWIDENLSEQIVIDSPEKEKQVVDIYFDGDWDKYRKNLIT